MADNRLKDYKSLSHIGLTDGSLPSSNEQVAYNTIVTAMPDRTRLEIIVDSSTPRLLTNCPAEGVLTIVRASSTKVSFHFDRIGTGNTDISAFDSSASPKFKGWRPVWNQFNDGSESGLDADKLDGLGNRSFLRRDIDDFSPNRFLLNRQSGGSSPEISLAIGDSDTGFDWVQDGYLKFMANNSQVMNMNASRLSVLKPIETTGDLIVRKTNGRLRFQETTYTTGNSGLEFLAVGPSQAMTMLHEVQDSRILGSANGQVLRIHGTAETSHAAGLEIQGEIYSQGQLVMHKGNDGSGSGFDADKLDGIEGTSYIRRDIDQQYDHNLISKTTNGSGITHNAFGTSIISNGNGDGADYDIYNVKWRLHQSLAFSDHTDVVRGIYKSRSGTWDVYGGYYKNGVEMWHAGNDGSGSGLDADLLGGTNHSQFLRNDIKGSLGGTGFTTLPYTTFAINEGDAGLAIVSTNSGSNGSRLSFAEVDNTTRTNFINQWGMIKKTSVGGNSLLWTFGTSKDVASNDIKMALSSDGILKLNNYKVWHQGNDGPGSDLNADKLDDLQASQFLRSDQSDSMNGALTINGPGENPLKLNSAGNTYLSFNKNGTRTGYIQKFNKDIIIGNDESSGKIYYSQGKGSDHFKEIMHKGNHGHNSGFDADTLDGIQGSQFLRKDANDTISGTLFSSMSSSEPQIGVHRTGTIDSRLYLYSSETSAGLYHIDAQGGKGILRMPHSDHNALYTECTNMRIGGSTGGQVWHSKNDGAGSGLDAGKLAGKDPSWYLDFNNIVNVPDDKTLTEEAVQDIIGKAFNDATHVNTTIIYDDAASTLKVSTPDGTINQKGVVQSTSAYNSGSTTLVANAKALKDGLATKLGLTSKAADSEKVDGVSSERLVYGEDDTAAKLYSTGATIDSTPQKASFAWATDDCAGKPSGTRYGSVLVLPRAAHGNYSSQLFIDNTLNSNMFVRTRGESGGYHSWSKLWSDKNDGSGSNLDADKLDGIQGNQFARIDSPNIITGHTQFRNNETVFNHTGSVTVRIDADTDDLSESDVPTLMITNDNRKGQLSMGIESTANLSYIYPNRQDQDSQSSQVNQLHIKQKNGTFGKIWHSLNDGAGSNLDADKLDGIQGSQFLRGNYILNDGSNSAGIKSSHASETEFLIGNSGPGQALLKLDGASNDDGSDGCYGYITHKNSGGMDIAIGGNNPGEKIINIMPDANDPTKRLTIDTDSVRYGGSTVWHAGNDGAGSNLDADKLDGIQGSSFLRSDANDILNANITVASSYGVLFPDEGILSGDADVDVLKLTSGVNLELAADTNFNDAGQAVLIKGGNNVLKIQSSAAGTNNDKLTYNDHKVWNAGNDGAGSGLDADTVDGIEGTNIVKNNDNNVSMASGGFNIKFDQTTKSISFIIN